MRNYTVIDILHTKWKRKSKDCTSDEIIKIDAVKLSFDETNYTFEIKEKFLTLIKPQYSDPQKLYDLFSNRLDGFSVDDLKNAPRDAVALKRLRRFMGNSNHVMFDLDELLHLFYCGKANKIKFPCVKGDIVSMARDVFCDRKRSFDLMMLTKYFDMDFKPSEFLTRRVEIMAQVFVKLNEKLGLPPKQKPAKDFYFELVQENNVRRNISKYRKMHFCFEYEDEIRILQQAKLDEAFLMLVKMLTELSRNNICYKLNGAINMSRLAYDVKKTDTKVPFRDYYFARFINPYQNSSLKAPNLCVSIDISPDDISAAEKIMRDYANNYAIDRTLCAISVDSATIPKEYAVAEKDGFSVLDISINPSEELARYIALKSSITNNRNIEDEEVEEVFKYIQKNPIKVFDNAERYLHTLREIKLYNSIEYVILALAVCDSDRTDILKNVVRRQKKEDSNVVYHRCDALMYQEQAMSILCELSGCSQFYADNIRIAMSKHDKAALEKYKHAFLFGGDDVYGMQFGGCAANNEIEIGKYWWKKLYEVMPKLYLKAHARAKAKFFLECAKLQMQSE